MHTDIQNYIDDVVFPNENPEVEGKDTTLTIDNTKIILTREADSINIKVVDTFDAEHKMFEVFGFSKEVQDNKTASLGPRYITTKRDESGEKMRHFSISRPFLINRLLETEIESEKEQEPEQ